MGQFNEAKYNETVFNGAVEAEAAEAAVPSAKFNDFQYNTVKFNQEGREGGMQQMVFQVASYVGTVASSTETVFDNFIEIIRSSYVDTVNSSSNAEAAFFDTAGSYVDTVSSTSAASVRLFVDKSSFVDTVSSSVEALRTGVIKVSSFVGAVGSEGFRHVFSRSSDIGVDVDEQDSLTGKVNTAVNKTLDIITESDEKADGQ